MQIDSGFIESVFSYAYSSVSNYMNNTAAYAVSLVIAFIVFAILLSLLVVLFVYLFGWGERKIMARIQSRHGPTYVGKFGILQNMADVVKLLSKEHIIPDQSDKPLFQMVLPIIYALFMMILAFIPFTGGFVGIGSTISLLVIFALLSFSPLLLFLAGWTSGNKFGSISAQRSVMVMVSYEIPMLLVVVAVAMLAHSFSLINIVNAQGTLWFAILMPIGFIVFFITMLAELERPPFDVREADNELIAGWLTDVSAPYYSLALFLDYTRMFVGTLLISILFLGGWSGPSFLPAFAWIFIKVIALSVFIIIIRATTVRMKIDRILRTGWTYMIALSVLNLIATFLIFAK